MAEVTIYALLDVDGRVRYVGKANDASKRLQTHIRDSRRRRTPVCDWVKSRIASGIVPVMRVLEICDSETWKDREKYWISHFRAIGSLLNLADGGDEPYCSRDIRKSNGRKVSALRVSTPEKARFYYLKKRLAQGLKAGYASPETKEKIREGARRHPELLGSLLRFL